MRPFIVRIAQCIIVASCHPFSDIPIYSKKTLIINREAIARFSGRLAILKNNLWTLNISNNRKSYRKQTSRKGLARLYNTC